MALAHLMHICWSLTAGGTLEKTGLAMILAVILLTSWVSSPVCSQAGQEGPCLKRFSFIGAFVVAGPEGQILCKKNETRKCVPASTLKLLTALAAIRHLGLSYRFRTEFYLGPDHDLKVKGYGDPLLISEVWQEIADALSVRIQGFRDLIVDAGYFSRIIEIPGVGHSTNPYDAPVGALCANFNTVNFYRDQKKKIVTAEPQTPMVPFAREKIRALGLSKGRHTFTHDPLEAARYAGELLFHFLRDRGIEGDGKVRIGAVRPEDRLFYTYRSRFTLEEILKQIMVFSNNFMPNQVLIAMGAQAYGPPGTLDKGVRVVSDYAAKELNAAGIEFVEGSGLSRENRLTAMDMLAVLEKFKPHRHLLRRSGRVLFKTGTLEGIRTRAGYVEGLSEGPCSFAVFLDRDTSDIDRWMECIEESLPCSDPHQAF
ncbi:MAG: D-alanyl-D-alanine carboxypeptidase [Thermodesulfobacteriota bacterium]|nr:D-alanyl-D-alanine carboxypeptidase [Thermodesulfobacteriota bacterium]